jgi:predicted nucleotidyltransferase
MSQAELKDSVLETLVERKYMRGLLGALPRGQLVVLVGSWARGTAVSPGSDIDVLVVGEGEPALAPSRLQVMLISAAEFRRRLMAGDDFPQWALRFGVPLSGRRAWESLRRKLLPKAPWPDPERKLQQATRKRNAAEALLAMGDVPAAEEEVRFALSHLARAELLSRRVFPLSRPELSSQLEAIGNRDLASMMGRGNSQQPMSEQEVRNALAFVRDRLKAEARPGSASRLP